MAEGDAWEIYCPAELAYGDAGRSSEARGQYIPPGAVLVFVLSMLKVKGPSKPKPLRPAGYVERQAGQADEVGLDADASKPASLRSDNQQPSEHSTPRATGGAPPIVEQQEVEPRVSRWAEEARNLEATPSDGGKTAHDADQTEAEPKGSSGWLGGLFERPAAAPQEAAEATVLATSDPARDTGEVDVIAGRLNSVQREAMEQAALEAVQSILTQLRLPTLKQTMADLGMPTTSGSKAALTQRLSQKLAASALDRALNAA